MATIFDLVYTSADSYIYIIFFGSDHWLSRQFITFHDTLPPFKTVHYLSPLFISFTTAFTFHDSSFTYPSYLSTIRKSITRISWTNVVPPCVPASVQSVDFFSQHSTVASPQSTASNNIYNNIRSRILQLYSLSRHYSTFHASVLHFTTIYYLSRQFISVHDSLLPFMTVSYLFWQFVTFHDRLLPFTAVFYLAWHLLSFKTFYHRSRQFITFCDSLLPFTSVFFLHLYPTHR